jgi:carboxylesterase type B
MLKDTDQIDDLNANWTMVAPEVIGLPDTSNADIIVDKIRTFYFGNASIGNETERNLTNLVSDRFMVYCSKAEASLHSQYSPVYMYYISKRPRKSYMDSSLVGFPPGDYGTHYKRQRFAIKFVRNHAILVF